MFEIRFFVIFTYISCLDIDVEKIYDIHIVNINSLEFPFTLLLLPYVRKGEKHEKRSKPVEALQIPQKHVRYKT